MSRVSKNHMGPYCYFGVLLQTTPPHYTCHLSRIMHESHACRSKIVISSIQTNFSRLTDNSECNCLKTDQIKMQVFFDVREVVRTSSGLFNNARDWLEVLKSSKIFLHLRLSSEVVGKSSEVVGNIRRSSQVFRNLRQSSEDVDEKCHAFYGKKLAGIPPPPHARCT